MTLLFQVIHNFCLDFPMHSCLRLLHRAKFCNKDEKVFIENAGINSILQGG
jgi:hypothetical protein